MQNIYSLSFQSGNSQVGLGFRETDRNWKTYVQDAVLEKCGPKHGIVHLFVDEKSKEVRKVYQCSNYVR